MTIHPSIEPAQERKRLGSCEVCHFHSSGIGEQCRVHFYGERCEGYIRVCCCGGDPIPEWRNDPAPRNPPTTDEHTKDES
jgi:hypothetical protein